MIIDGESGFNGCHSKAYQKSTIFFEKTLLILVLEFLKLKGIININWVPTKSKVQEKAANQNKTPGDFPGAPGACGHPVISDYLIIVTFFCFQLFLRSIFMQKTFSIQNKATKPWALPIALSPKLAFHTSIKDLLFIFRFCFCFQMGNEFGSITGC